MKNAVLNFRVQLLFYFPMETKKHLSVSYMEKYQKNLSEKKDKVIRLMHKLSKKRKEEEARVVDAEAEEVK